MRLPCVDRDAARCIELRRHAVDRQGHIKLGRGPTWVRLLNGLGSTSACRDVVLAAAPAAARAGISKEALLAEIDRRIAAPSPLLLREDGLVLNKLLGGPLRAHSFAAGPSLVQVSVMLPRRSSGQARHGPRLVFCRRGRNEGSRHCSSVSICRSRRGPRCRSRRRGGGCTRISGCARAAR